MKKVLLLLSLLPMFSFGQAFYFNDTSTTLIKTTDQTPAHWYIEIFSNELVDTTLRWKTTFSNIPPQWGITFDDQDNNYPVINDGDSADFTLFTGWTFPQKLIIGAHLNNTAGEGSVLFDIYDPNDPSFVQVIEYHFIVGYLTLETLNQNGIDVRRNDDQLVVTSEDETIQLYIHSMDGKLLYTESVFGKSKIDLKMIKAQQAIYSIHYNNSLYVDRIPIGL
jgi:hypothetical protein